MNDEKTIAEPEVTPEMIEAGTNVLYRMTTHIADEEYWAEEIYRAMASLRPASSRTVL
jgi:hypothetical protein